MILASLFNDLVAGARYPSAVGIRAPGSARHKGNSLASSSRARLLALLSLRSCFRKTCAIAHTSPCFPAARWYYWIYCRQQLQYFQNIKRGLIVAFHWFDPAINKLRADSMEVSQHYIAQHSSQPVVTDKN